MKGGIVQAFFALKALIELNIRPGRKIVFLCNTDEETGSRSFICSDSISPKFVKRLVQEYGYESIESAFLIRGGHQESHLEYLLRRYKGAYYRIRYPRIALV